MASGFFSPMRPLSDVDPGMQPPEGRGAEVILGSVWPPTWSNASGRAATKNRHFALSSALGERRPEHRPVPVMDASGAGLG
jgi:hypothetical protein